MGTRGQIPKRSDHRRRQNKPEIPVDKAPSAATGETKPRPAKKEWHPIAKQWYWSLARSGQSVFYEAADWETAWMLAEAMSREFKPRVVGNTSDGEPILAEVPPRAAALTAWRQTMAALMVTEGDRRRMRLELDRPAPAEGPADVSELDEYRRRLQSS